MSAPDHRADPQYQIGWLSEGCRIALRTLETIQASESTPPETRERLHLVADDLRQTLSVLSRPTTARQRMAMMGTTDPPDNPYTDLPWLRSGRPRIVAHMSCPELMAVLGLARPVLVRDPPKPRAWIDLDMSAGVDWGVE